MTATTTAAEDVYENGNGGDSVATANDTKILFQMQLFLAKQFIINLIKSHYTQMEINWVHFQDFYHHSVSAHTHQMKHCEIV